MFHVVGLTAGRLYLWCSRAQQLLDITIQCRLSTYAAAACYGFLSSVDYLWSCRVQQLLDITTMQPESVWLDIALV